MQSPSLLPCIINSNKDDIIKNFKLSIDYNYKSINKGSSSSSIYDYLGNFRDNLFKFNYIDMVHFMYSFVYDPYIMLSSSSSSSNKNINTPKYFSEVLQIFCSFLNEIVQKIKNSRRDGKKIPKNKDNSNIDIDDTDENFDSNSEDIPTKYIDSFKITVFFIGCCFVKFIGANANEESQPNKPQLKKVSSSKKITNISSSFDSPLSQNECDTIREIVLESLISSIFVNKPCISTCPRIDYMQILWSGRTPDDSFLNIYWKLASYMIEKASPKPSSCGINLTENDDFAMVEDDEGGVSTQKKGKKTKLSAQNSQEKITIGSKSHALIAELVCSLVFKYYEQISQPVLGMIIKMINSNQYGVESAACIIYLLASNDKPGCFQQPRLADELFLEISKSSSKSVSNESTKLTGSFIEEISKMMPKRILSNSSMLLPLLGSDDNNMRNSIIKVIGNLIIYLRPNETTTSMSQATTAALDESFSNTSSEENNQSTRNTLLDILCKRVHDVFHSCRSTTLKVWTEIAKSKAIPLSYIHPVTKHAIDRLSDKSVYVRKDSIALLITLLEDNPYNSRLDPDYFTSKVIEAETWIKQNRHKIEKAHQEKINEMEKSKQERKEIQKERKRRESLAKNIQLPPEDEVDDEEENDEDLQMDENDEKLVQQTETEIERTQKEKIALLEYCESAVTFVRLMSDVCEKILPLLLSKTTSDVLASMRFFTKAHEFKIPNAEKGIRQMLVLIWDTRDSEKVKKELMENFEELYIMASHDGTAITPNPPHEIARNLVLLATNATLAELTSLEQVVAEAMRSDGVLKKRILPKTAIDALWEIAGNMKNDIIDEARAALCILGMAASVSPVIVSQQQNIQKLLEIGFGENTKKTKDYSFVRYSCSALIPALTSCRVSVLNDDNDSNEQFSYLQQIEQQVIDFLVHTNGWEYNNSIESKDQKNSNRNNEKILDTRPQWFPAAENCIGVLFLVNNKPEIVCANIIKLLHEYTFKKSSKTSTEVLSRLLFVVGHFSIKLLVFAERAAQEARRKRTAFEDQNLQGLPEAPKKLKISQNEPSKSEKDEKDDSDQMDMLGANGEDDKEDVLANKIAENELVAPGTLLGNYEPLIKKIIYDDPELLKKGTIINENNKINDNLTKSKKESSTSRKHLQEACVLALCKFMAVSSSFCNENLPLLFTILRDAESSYVRANIIISLGDLASRFPNLVEPFAKNMYDSLRDNDVGVRKNTLMVCAHLILNGMVKVRENISEISLCIEDEDPRIRDLSCLFFSELSKRSGSPLFNLIPEILSQLSRDPAVSKEKYRAIAKFLLDFVSKDSQADSIAEKLCQRIYKATGFSGENDNVVLAEIKELAQCKDFAFALENLKIGEKMVKKMNDELFKLYSPCLGDEEIFQSFYRIATSQNRGSSSKNDQENRRIVEEWRNKLQKYHSDLGSNDKVAKNAQKAKSKTKKMKQ